MKFWCRRTRSRGSVSATTTTSMIITYAADRAEFLLWDMDQYVPDLIPTTDVLNLLIRCYINLLGPPCPGQGLGEGGRWRTRKPADIPIGPSPCPGIWNQ